jgi:LCP family protein required for cell wall assembly
VLAGLGCLDGALLVARIQHVAVRLHPGPGTTWVVVGLDSRADLPPGTSSQDLGTPEDVPGSRADVVLVVHATAAGTSVLSIPRDLVVGTGERAGRLALSWLDGPQATVDALCGLGIPTDHLVALDLAGFVAVVDAAGGMDVDVPAPVRDPAARLLVPRAGRLHVDGATALALVRSRHPEQRVDGRWVPEPVDPDGRARAAGVVLSAVAAAVRGSALSPWRLQRVGWAGTGALTVDRSTSVTDLASLARADVGQATVLPAGEPVGGTLVRFPTGATSAAVRAAGMSCAG